ncbi:nucleotide-binding universal stress UspA family protein [Actinomadura pelletieri DSM 43383]|uniref:Nucleotide-binding universal stress UspA family protein n=1 Tax=Actinomadura pelletieri DSM 43383 TaxID=1120940 RepID=A0A495QGI2_9ACTN|nr:universal stress protein [Actinomadura pelletieri]RKS71032.1 nucleotide-binding universal stress UspA family protein [Actinomadura pelletieri DSM 43383]
MSEPIVVGVDGSEQANRALDWAAADAVLRDRPLHIVHAVESWPYKAPIFVPPETPEYLNHVGRRILATARESVQERWPDLVTTTALVTNEAPQALREQSEKAFELVLGSRGRGGFASLLLGSVSLRMAGRSPVPVVIVRGDATDRGEVVVGIDLLGDAEAVLDHAFDAANVHGARLRVVHAWQTFATLVEAGYAFDYGQIELGMRNQVVAAYEPLRAEYPRVEVVDEVVMGHPVTALSNASRNARLLVVGAHDRRWNVPRLGSVGHGVIHHSECPVAVVPIG